MHIGLIGGIGPAATDYYYRGLIKATADSGNQLDATIVHADSSTLIANLGANDQDAQSAIFLKLIDRLGAAGADCVAVTSIAGHFCIGPTVQGSPLPVINLVTAMNAELQRLGLSRVGLLGTKTVMETGIYGGLGDVACLQPDGQDLDNVHDAYVEMAISGTATDEHRDIFMRAGRQMFQDQGAEAVLLAGTDLFLAFEGYDCDFNVLDCAKVHIGALAEKARS